MIKQFMKSILFVVLITPLASLAMEEPDKIELGKELAAAADRKDWATVKNLITRGADLNQRDFSGWTPLMNAAKQGQENIAQLLIAAEADLNSQTRMGYTALRIAAFYGNEKFAHILIDAMLAQNAVQKKRIYTFLLCLKQISGFKNTNQARDLFKPLLLPTLTDVRQEINRIVNDKVKNRLLEKYGLRPNSNSEAQ